MIFIQTVASNVGQEIFRLDWHITETFLHNITDISLLMHSFFGIAFINGQLLFFLKILHYLERYLGLTFFGDSLLLNRPPRVCFLLYFFVRYIVSYLRSWSQSPKILVPVSSPCFFFHLYYRWKILENCFTGKFQK